MSFLIWTQGLLNSAGAVSRSYTGSGGIVFGGTAAVAQGNVYQGSGGLLFAGAAATSRTAQRVYTGSGGIAFSGNAAVAQGNAYASSGGLFFGGSALTLFEPAAVDVLVPAAGIGSLLRPWMRDFTRPAPRTFAYHGNGSLAISGAAVTALELAPDFGAIAREAEGRKASTTMLRRATLEALGRDADRPSLRDLERSTRNTADALADRIAARKAARAPRTFAYAGSGGGGLGGAAVTEYVFDDSMLICLLAA